MLEAKSSAPHWILDQLRQLLAQQGHAWLLQGPSGLGQYTLALALVQAWLCEHPDAQGGGACGHCASCHAIGVRTHADLFCLIPETTMLELGWPLSEKAQDEIDSKKRKPSREIRVDAMRDAIEFSQRTSARGRGKAVLVFPAEQMNTITANALLKTLEEPPGDVRFVLATEAAHELLPTIRSRCQVHNLHWPERAEALRWLISQNIDADLAESLLRFSGDRPDAAVALRGSEAGGLHGRAFAQAMLKGDIQAVKNWPVGQLIDAQHKLCHDLLAVGQGASPRFFEASALQTLPTASIHVLTEWAGTLKNARKTMDHPFNAGLMQEALMERAQSALNSRT